MEYDHIVAIDVTKSSNIKYDKIVHWCMRTINSDFWAWDYQTHRCDRIDFSFKNEDDAMLFKLTWC